MRRILIAFGISATLAAGIAPAAMAMSASVQALPASAAATSPPVMFHS